MADVEGSVHGEVGGDPFFVALVERFYAGVATDLLLRPLYPDDLNESKRTLTGFLIQYWGGSTAYSTERGHPRLRMRHGPFAIGEPERDAWLRHMHAALEATADEFHLSDLVRQRMREYFAMAADAMRNVG